MEYLLKIWIVGKASYGGDGNKHFVWDNARTKGEEFSNGGVLAVYEGCGKGQVPLEFTIPLAVDLDLCVATGYCMCMVDYLC